MSEALQSLIERVEKATLLNWTWPGRAHVFVSTRAIYATLRGPNWRLHVSVPQAGYMSPHHGEHENGR